MKETAKSDMKQDKAMVKKAVNKHESKLHPGAPKTKTFSKGGMVARGGGVAVKGTRFSHD
jgi:hypothetical protein